MSLVVVWNVCAYILDLSYENENINSIAFQLKLQWIEDKISHFLILDLKQ
jgi:hypothetical protein